MTLLQQYLTRKKFTEPMIAHVRETGFAAVPPNWTNYFIGEEMMFSHRCNTRVHTRYFSEGEFHAHGHYEMLIHIRGEVEYIQNDRKIHPRPGTVMWCRPENMHTFRLGDSEYERYLLYFSPEFFGENGQRNSPILQFAENRDMFALQVEEGSVHTLRALLERIEQTLRSELPYKNLLAKALIVELFALFNASQTDAFEPQNLDDPMAEIKKYIDRNYVDISGMEQIAAHFHYSREHLSRKFKSRFGTSVSEYLSRRRIIESTHLLRRMSVTEACYAVGFRNPSVYIAAFKKNMGCLPSAYKKQRVRERDTAI